MKKTDNKVISKLLVFAFVISFACINPAGASSSLIIDHSETISIEAGENVEVSLSIDDLPDGFSGYIMTVELDNPSVATIESVSFPSWAKITDISDLPDSSVWLKASDTDGNIGEGSKDAAMVTITLKGLSAGSTGISVDVSKMDSDLEKPIEVDDVKYDEYHKSSSSSSSGSSSLVASSKSSVEAMTTENSSELISGEEEVSTFNEETADESNQIENEEYSVESSVNLEIIGLFSVLLIGGFAGFLLYRKRS